ncbi:ADOP family duplicated permease [Rhodanobacter sp. DHG33]|uniref:ADOP family duplicated permease n=1 Tax=Rhodanobacter sp. DHG33 TaxID=2775921 RepID=UPI001783A05F|nr:ADOP family duplicated permease [Rhodanobacter sp. DHG33]MBD8897560.1 ABC transporter permease [Rhodanobacter sp. DHG33]
MIVREFRGAWRRLMRRPGYALLSVAMLGVGLGVVLFLFGLVNTMILRPLPFPQADRLIAVGEQPSNGYGIGTIDSDQYLQLQGHLRSVEMLGAYAQTGFNLDSGDGANFARGTRLTASMMQLLGVEPILGRGFIASDEVPGAAPVVLLGETLWRQDFHADPHIVGHVVQVNGEPATVIGVLSADFGFPQASQLWMPLQLRQGQHLYISGVARLAPGFELSQAGAELAARGDAMQLALPMDQRGLPLTVRPLSVSFVPEDMRGWVWLMFGATGLVLLLACVNVANLQLVQTLNRRRELALRSALGGGRWRLMVGVLVESLLLSVAALAVAVPIMQFGNRWLIGVFVASDDPPNMFFRFGIDGRVLLFGFGVGILCTALAGLVSAWRAARADLQDALRDGSKGSGSGFAQVAKVLVVAEVVLTVVLLVGAGMFVRALGGLMAERSIGATHAAQVLTADVALPPARYTDDAQRIRFLDTVVERLRSDPAVIDASASDTIPSAQLGSHEDVSLPGQPQPSDGWPRVQMGIVDPHFLATYGVRLRAGRFFDARDRADNAPVAVVDAKLAEAMWPHGDALGRKLVLWPGRTRTLTLTVVGVIEPLQLDSALERPLPGLLLPLEQAATQGPLRRRMGLAVRTHADAETYVRQLTAAVREVDPQAAVHAMYSQAKAMAITRVKLQVMTEVFAALGLVALLLAGAGLYGVLAFSVAQRTREIGIRRAIGAGHGAIVRTVARQLAWQLGLGLGIGLLLAVPWSGVLADPGLHTRAHDPAVFVPVLLLVIGVSAFAALVPLLRALRVDPAVALRYE